MADNARAGLAQDRRAKTMVGVHMGQDQPFDRQIGAPPNRQIESLADRPRAAGVNHRHRLLADDETGVGDIAKIGRRLHGDLALVDENAGGDLADRDAESRSVGVTPDTTPALGRHRARPPARQRRRHRRLTGRQGGRVDRY